MERWASAGPVIIAWMFRCSCKLQLKILQCKKYGGIFIAKTASLIKKGKVRDK